MKAEIGKYRGGRKYVQIKEESKVGEETLILERNVVETTKTSNTKYLPIFFPPKNKLLLQTFIYPSFLAFLKFYNQIK